MAADPNIQPTEETKKDRPSTHDAVEGAIDHSKSNRAVPWHSLTSKISGVPSSKAAYSLSF
jgi:hypothetical protein